MSNTSMSENDYRLYGVVFTIIAIIALIALVFVVSARSEIAAQDAAGELEQAETTTVE